MKKLGRKFWLVVVAGAIFIANDLWGWGLTEETIENVVIVVGGFVGVEGIADIVSRFKKNK